MRVCVSAGMHACMRVFHCSYVRKGSAFLQASRQLDVFTAMNASALEHFTEVMGVVQHHDAGVVLSAIGIVVLRLLAGYRSSGPIEKILGFCDHSVREKDWRGKPGLWAHAQHTEP